MTEEQYLKAELIHDKMKQLSMLKAKLENDNNPEYIIMPTCDLVREDTERMRKNYSHKIKETILALVNGHLENLHEDLKEI